MAYFKIRKPVKSVGIGSAIEPVPIAASTGTVLKSNSVNIIALSTVAGTRVFKVAAPKPGDLCIIYADMRATSKPVSIRPVSTTLVKIANRASGTVALTTAYGAFRVEFFGRTSTSWVVSVVGSTR